jgi:hypothetical protein
MNGLNTLFSIPKRNCIAKMFLAVSIKPAFGALLVHAAPMIHPKTGIAAKKWTPGKAALFNNAN